jgi:hypothetical protein
MGSYWLSQLSLLSLLCQVTKALNKDLVLFLMSLLTLTRRYPLPEI